VGIQVAKGAAIKISRLEGRLLKLGKTVSQHLTEIADIEAKLVAFRVVVPVLAHGEEAPVYPPRAPSRPKRKNFSHGEQSRLTLKYLRELVGRPTTTVEITNWRLDAKGASECPMAERIDRRVGKPECLRAVAPLAELLPQVHHRAGANCPDSCLPRCGDVEPVKL
jgi:hypothetical protein